MIQYAQRAPMNSRTIKTLKVRADTARHLESIGWNRSDADYAVQAASGSTMAEMLRAVLR